MERLKVLGQFLGGLTVIATIFLASPSSAQQCAAAREPKGVELKSNDYFEVISPSEVRFRPDVYFEIVKTKAGLSFIRFGEAAGQQMAGGLVCGCGGGCSGKCDTDNNGGSATCTGGCYEASGTACTSCIFRNAEAE